MIKTLFNLILFCLLAPFIFGFLYIFGALYDLKQGTLFYTPKEGGKCLKCGGDMQGRGYNGFECKDCHWEIEDLVP